jgi:hypothetical protein
MKNQIFKTIVAPDIIWTFLKENGEETTDHFMFDKVLYKKAVFKEMIEPFVKSLIEHYHESKKHYINRKLDYNKFVTVLRQLCNSNDIEYKTQMVYNSSTYEIVYTFGKSIAKPQQPLEKVAPHP